MISDTVKLKAFALRKDGKSYNQIAETLGLHKSALAYWFRDVDWSRDIKEQLRERALLISAEKLVEHARQRSPVLKKSYKNARKEAVTKFQSLKSDPLFISGVALYWGDGGKSFKNGHIRLANTDPEMLFVFRRFLGEICKISINKISVWALLYPDNNIEDSLSFWSERVNIPRERFNKPTITQGRHKTRRLNHGICTLQVCNKRLQAKILKWVDLLGLELTNQDARV